MKNVVPLFFPARVFSEGRSVDSDRLEEGVFGGTRSYFIPSFDDLIITRVYKRLGLRRKRRAKSAFQRKETKHFH